MPRYKRILYFSAGGTWLIMHLPSSESEAKTHASAADHTRPKTDCSCSSYLE